MKVTLLAVGLVGALSAHDFFVSILTIRHSPKDRSLDLTWRMTAHDIEHALENVAHLKLGSAQEHPKADSILNAYLHEHLQILDRTGEMEWKWVGRELDGETLYCYLQIAGVGIMDSVTVSNTLLQDLYYEQQNLVHLEAQDRPTLSHTFVVSGGPHTFSW